MSLPSSSPSRNSPKRLPIIKLKPLSNRFRSIPYPTIRTRLTRQTRDLTDMLAQSINPGVYRTRDIHHDVRFIRMPEKHVAHNVRLKPFLKLLWKMQMVSRIRIDGILHRHPRVPMVAMIEPIKPKRVMGENHNRAIRPDRLHNVAQKLPIRLQHPIRIRQHHQIRHADHISRICLLPSTNIHDLLRCHRLIVAAAAAGRANHIRNLATIPSPQRRCTASPDLRIVRMRAHHHRALRYLGEML